MKNIIIFGYEVLRKEGLTEWKIEITGGDEGLCRRATKTIAFGEGAIKKNYYWLMLHEIAHCLSNACHYSEEFEDVLKNLYIVYLRGKRRKMALERRSRILKSLRK